MIAHCVSVKVIRIKATSHLVTLNHSDNRLGILKRHGLEEIVQPAAVQAFGYSLAPTEQGNVRISAQAGKDNANLLLGLIVPASLPLVPRPA